MMIYCLYKITNLLNGKMYIGRHKTDNIDDGYMGSGLLIRRAVAKYGAENFRKEYLMFCEDEEELDYMEYAFVDQTWVDRSDTYNLRVGGDRGGVSDETREKMSYSAKNRPKMSGETRRRIGEANRGERNYWFGRHLPDEVKAKLRAKAIKRRHTEETKAKMAKSHTGVRFSEERKKKISEKIKGLHWYNNGKVAVMRKECPVGFTPGMLKKGN